MKSLINLLAIILIFCILGCSKKIDKNTKDIVKIDVESNIKNFKPMKLSEIASSVEYIPLQSSSSFLIGYIRSIDMNGQHILVEAQQESHNGILLFDDKGKFLREIGRQGNGPGEYRIPGVTYLVDNVIFIPSVIKSKILVYDLRGKFVEAIPITDYDISSAHKNWLPLSISEFLLQVSNRRGDEQFRIVKINKEGDIVHGYDNTTKFKPYHGTSGGSDARSGYFYYIGEKIRYKEIVNDTIWEVSADSLTPVYVISRGKFGLDVDYRTLPRPQRYNCIRINSVHEVCDYIFFETHLMAHYPFSFYKGIMGNGLKWPYPVLGVYRKKKAETFFVEPSKVYDKEFPPGIPTGLENDIDGGINFFPSYKESDSVLVSWIDAFKLIEYTTSETFQKAEPIYPEKRKDLKKLVNSLSSNDNPILMVVKLK